MAKTINVYSAGGCGMNIASKFMKQFNREEVGYATIHPIFIDTSKSNISLSVPADNIYLVDGLDGSGKKRDSNYTVLSECCKDILHQHKPAALNIVLHSASGGSGSVIGPILVSELLSRGELVIVMMVGTTGSRIETENTLKTLKSYEVISRKRELPVVAHYREITSDKPRSIVDAEVHTAIVLLSNLFSGDNAELDSADLINFINYQKVTSYTAKLSLLDFFACEPKVPKGQALISVVTLTDEKSSSNIEAMVDYHTVGILPEKAARPNIGFPVHGCIIAGYFGNVVSQLETKLTAHDEQRSVVVEKLIVNEKITSTEEGLVL